MLSFNFKTVKEKFLIRISKPLNFIFIRKNFTQKTNSSIIKMFEETKDPRRAKDVILQDAIMIYMNPVNRVKVYRTKFMS